MAALAWLKTTALVVGGIHIAWYMVLIAAAAVYVATGSGADEQGTLAKQGTDAKTDEDFHGIREVANSKETDGVGA